MVDMPLNLTELNQLILVLNVLLATRNDKTLVSLMRKK